MESVLAALIALMDEATGKPTGAFKQFLDERALGLANMLAEARRDAATAADDAADAMARDAEIISALIEEVSALNREIVELTARTVVLTETQARLEEQHRSDRAHIRELIAEMVRRDVR
jgi:hypothetical protein